MVNKVLEAVESNTGVDKLWVEKYRPGVLEDIVLSTSTRQMLAAFIKNGEIPNLMFCGHQGIGKTTTAKMLIKTLDAEHIYQNCSEVGIDAVRNDITGFSRTKSFNGQKKIVLLDEVDGMASIEAQRSLRNVLEEYAAHCRFILTCNYRHRVIGPLQSRCQAIDLEPNITDVLKRCLYILKAEQIKVAEDAKKQLVLLVRKYFPDIRKCINEMQKYSITGTLLVPDLNIQDGFAEKIIELILNKKATHVRKLIIESETVFHSDYATLMKALFDSICNEKRSLTEQRKKLWLITVGEYMYRSAFVLDQEINFYCLVLALSEITS